MAIKLPDPGNGIPEQKTGNDEWTNMKIVRDNFADQSNAASRLVGTANGQLPQAQDISNLAFNTKGKSSPAGSVADYEGGIFVADSSNTDRSPHSYANILTLLGFHNTRVQFALPYNANAHNLYFRTRLYSSNPTPAAYQPWGLFYTDRNTTKDTATGFLKASSPVLHVYNDSITKIHEAEQLDITVDKKGVGHYEIHGTTGLRKDDGWFMSPPRDVHGNVLCMVDLDEKDGVVILKTYKKMFDFETVSIVHDWDNPMDIPEGVCVEFRFNDLPEEQLDEPIE